MFDRLGDNFLFRTMEVFGYGNGIVGWIKLLYNCSQSRVKCNATCVLQQYADDITITVKDEESVGRIIGCMERYGEASGAKINIDKSKMMYMGGMEQKGSEAPLEKVRGSFKILGIYIGENERETRDQTWAEVLNKMKRGLSFWKKKEVKTWRESGGEECDDCVEDLLCFECAGDA